MHKLGTARIGQRVGVHFCECLTCWKLFLKGIVSQYGSIVHKDNSPGKSFYYGYDDFCFEGRNETGEDYIEWDIKYCKDHHEIRIVFHNICELHLVFCKKKFNRCPCSDGDRMAFHCRHHRRSCAFKITELRCRKKRAHAVDRNLHISSILPVSP